jgi:DNA-binding HxlR family transcriptional regulator
MKPTEAEERYIAILRAMSGSQRVKIGAELYEMARHIVASSIRNKYPNISEQELQDRLRERMRA